MDASSNRVASRLFRAAWAPLDVKQVPEGTFVGPTAEAAPSAEDLHGRMAAMQSVAVQEGFTFNGVAVSQMEGEDAL